MKVKGINVEAPVGNPMGLSLLLNDATIALIGDEVRVRFFAFVKDEASVDAVKYLSIKDRDAEGVAMAIGTVKA